MADCQMSVASATGRVHTRSEETPSRTRAGRHDRRVAGATSEKSVRRSHACFTTQCIVTCTLRSEELFRSGRWCDGVPGSSLSRTHVDTDLHDAIATRPFGNRGGRTFNW